MSKKIGIVGLGRMGSGVAQRLLAAGYVVYGLDRAKPSKVASEVIMVENYESLLAAVSVVFLVVPAGEVVDEVIANLLIARHEIASAHKLFVVDCGNSLYTDTLRRHEALVETGIIFLDAGISGGVHGVRDGYCVMAGGSQEQIAFVHNPLMAIAAHGGFAHVGPVGAGHYVKMVHNAIEYGMLQAYGEGFQLLKEGHYPDLAVAEIAQLWQNGSVIRSRLLELLVDVLKKPEYIAQISGVVHENGTGRWALAEAKKCGVPVPVIQESLKVRSWSRETGGNYATKLVALLRNAFGGHSVEKE